MQAPTGPTGIYSAWANLDVDGDGVANENPWHFGTASQYPVLLYGAQDPSQQRGDYDWDDNGLIEVRNLRQLNAMRWGPQRRRRPDRRQRQRLVRLGTVGGLSVVGFSH